MFLSEGLSLKINLGRRWTRLLKKIASGSRRISSLRLKSESSGSQFYQMKGRGQNNSRRVADGWKTRQATTSRVITVTGTNRLWRQQQRNQGRECQSKTLRSKVLVIRNRLRRGAKETGFFSKVVLSSKISNPQLDTRRGLRVPSD